MLPQKILMFWVRCWIILGRAWVSIAIAFGIRPTQTCSYSSSRTTKATRAWASSWFDCEGESMLCMSGHTRSAYTLLSDSAQPGFITRSSDSYHDSESCHACCQCIQLQCSHSLSYRPCGLVVVLHAHSHAGFAEIHVGVDIQSSWNISMGWFKIYSKWSVQTNGLAVNSLTSQI